MSLFRRVFGSVLAVLIGSTVLVGTPNISVAADYVRDVQIFPAVGKYYKPTTASGNFVPGTLTLEPGPGWVGGVAPFQTYYETSSLQSNGTYCFSVSINSDSALAQAYYGEMRANDPVTVCGPPGTVSQPITVRDINGAQIQGPAFFTIGQYEVQTCAPAFKGPEFEAAQAEAVTYAGKYASGYLPDVEWAYLDYRLRSDCQADARMWYLKRVAGGAGHGFVFHDGNDLKYNRVWTESFNGKTYNLRRKSVRKKLECRNTSLLEGQPPLGNPPDQLSIQFAHLWLVPGIANRQIEDLESYADYGLDPEWLGSFSEKNEEQVDKFGAQRCYAAPKTAGTQALVETTVDRHKGSNARIELWCNAFRCYTKEKSGTDPYTTAKRDTQKFIFKENSVVVKPWKQKNLSKF